MLLIAARGRYVRSLQSHGRGASMTPAEKETLHLESESGAESNTPPIAAKVTDRELWWEVTAVLAIGVLPWLCGAYVLALQPQERLHYGLDSLYLSFRSLCISVAVLYLIYRSREPWARFGITRPRFTDFFLALILLLGAECIWIVESQLGLTSSDPPERFFRPPTRAAHYVLMVIKFAASGFTEELVTRAYLVTRLESLLKSSVKAVIVSAGLFASYHIYYGLGSFTYFLAFGMIFGVFFLFVRRIWPLALAHMVSDIVAELLMPN